MISGELYGFIAQRHAQTGMAGPTSYMFDGYGHAHQFTSTVPPLVSVVVPPWLVNGIDIKYEGMGAVGTAYDVIEVSSEMCLVRVVGTVQRFAVETDKIVKWWRPVANTEVSR